MVVFSDSVSPLLQVDGKPIKLELFDTAGQEGFDSIRPLAYPKTVRTLHCTELT